MIHSDMKKIVDLLIGIPDIPMIAYGKELFYKNGLYPAEILFTIEGTEIRDPQPGAVSGTAGSSEEKRRVLS